MSRDMNRNESMADVAETVERLIRLYGRRQDITITYCEFVNDEVMECFSSFARTHHGIFIGSEMFFIWENTDNADEPKRLLYAKDVTADSVLTAASELMNLCSRKF